jgi:mRNA interferase MazF
MVKLRPVVVLSPRLKRRDGLLTVVPLSTTPPDHIMDYHCLVTIHPPLPEPFDEKTMWVKADMIYNVAFSRLELVRTARDHTGKRKYIQQQISGSDLKEIRKAALAGLGMPELTKHI